jgi:Flp pilus assembly pilin Flp
VRHPAFFQKALGDTAGVAMTEYVILVGVVALGSIASFILLGAAFVRNFNLVRSLILLPFP